MLMRLSVLKTCRSRMAVEWCTHCSCSMCNASFLISTNALQVASPVNRQKALSMFINLVRWVRTVHDQCPCFGNTQTLAVQKHVQAIALSW